MTQRITPAFTIQLNKKSGGGISDEILLHRLSRSGLKRDELEGLKSSIYSSYGYKRLLNEYVYRKRGEFISNPSSRSNWNRQRAFNHTGWRFRLPIKDKDASRHANLSRVSPFCIGFMLPVDVMNALTTQYPYQLSQGSLELRVKTVASSTRAENCALKFKGKIDIDGQGDGIAICIASSSGRGEKFTVDTTYYPLRHRDKFPDGIITLKLQYGIVETHSNNKCKKLIKKGYQIDRFSFWPKEAYASELLW